MLRRRTAWLATLCLPTLITTLACSFETDGPTPPRGVQDPDRVRMLVSGGMLGRLEPCGCASGQLGGLARRMQYIGERKSHDLLLEGGDLVDTATELDTLKLFTATRVLFGMERAYDALGVGSKDLALPLAEWSAFLGDAPVVASDLVATAPDWPGKPFREKDVRGTKVRIASLTLALPPALQQPDAPVRLLPPAEGWARGMADAAPATLRVLMFHGTDSRCREVVPTLEPAPDLVLCFDHGYQEPQAKPELLGKVPVLYPGIRGRVLLEVSLVRLPEGPRIGVDLVPLQGSTTVPGGGGDPNVKTLLLDHRQQVKDDGVLGRMSRQLPTPNGATYVGSAICQGCHTSAFDAWSKSKHAGAWTTLERVEADPKRYGWPVTHYPDCVSCHVVGHREQTGFVSGEETPHLAGVGCERCHGPGSDHAASNGQKPLGLHGGVAASLLCAQCHDYEQSPNFVYGDRWPVIQHGREPHQQKQPRTGK
jgi:hypothetical protein